MPPELVSWAGVGDNRLIELRLIELRLIELGAVPLET